MYILVGFALFVFIVIWIGLLGGLLYGIPYLKFVFPGPVFMSTLASLTIFIAIALPVMFIVLFFIRVLTGYRAPVQARRAMGGLWAASLVGAVFFGISTGREFNEADTLTESSQLALSSDTLKMQIRQRPESDLWFQLENNHVGEDALYLDNARFSFLRASGDQFELEKEMKARGRTSKQARESLESLKNAARLEDNVLYVNNYVAVPKSEKFRAQSIHYKVYIPEGKYLDIDGNIYYVGQVERDPNADHPTLSNNLWKMTPTGLISPVWTERNTLSEGDRFRDFNSIQVDGPMDVEIFQSDNFSIETVGRKEFLGSIRIDQLDRQLMISESSSRSRIPLKLVIGMPRLKSFKASNTDDITVHGFVQNRLDVKLKGTDNFEGQMQIDSLFIEAVGRNDIEIRGKGRYLDAWLENGSRLDAGRFETNKARILGTFTSVELSSLDTLVSGPGIIDRIRTEGKDPVRITE